MSLRFLHTAFCLLLLMLVVVVDCRQGTEPPPPPAKPDTTAHDVQWTVQDLGDSSGNNVLFDVSILNDTCVWVVGEMHLTDSTNVNTGNIYGAALWNGCTWSLKKVPYHDYGTTNVWPGPLRSVWAFSETSVYAASFANLLKWDGQNWGEKAFFMTSLPWNGQVMKMWARSENEIYCCGLSGALYEFDGYTWVQLSTGTGLDLHDIFGTQDGKELWVAGYNYAGDKTVILRKGDLNWQVVYTIPYPPGWNGSYFNGPVSTLWTYDGSEFGATGEGWVLWLPVSNPVNGSTIDAVHLGNFAYRMRGTTRNDIFVVGDGPMIWHYNGVSWHKYDELWTGQNSLYSVAVSKHLVVAVGTAGTVVIGRR